MSNGPDGGLGKAGADADAGFNDDAAGSPTPGCGSNPNPEACQPSKPDSPPISPVAPRIGIVVPVVLVKKPYTSKPKRQLVQLSTDSAFDGTGTFTITSGADKISFFNAAKGGSEINSGHVFAGSSLTRTVSLYAQGVKPSAAENDVILQLSLTPGSKPVVGPVTDKLTSVEVTLDICQSRTTPGVDPAVVADKIGVGRHLRVQKGNTAHRGMLIVRKAEPHSFTGNLVLNPLNNRVTVFAEADETPAAGQAALGRHTIPNSTIDEALGTKRWAEAASLSPALRDTGFQLGVDGVDDDGDRVVITAFTVDKIECHLRVTPCKRGGTPLGTNQSKKSTKDDRTFGSGYSTVIRDCGKLILIASVRPARVPMTWDRERAPDDTGLAGLPASSAGADDKHRIFKTDVTGSFNIMAFVDANGSGKRDPENDGLTFNIAMVELTVPAGAAKNKIVTNPNYHVVAFPGTLLVHSSTSNGNVPATGASYTDAEFTKHLIAMKVTVKLTGGGANQRRGTERIRLGYIQQTTADSVTGTYADGKTLKEKIFASPLPPNPVTAGTPAQLAFPVRDTRGAASNGSGTFIISSSDHDSSAIATGGLQKVVRFVDPPAIAIDLTHPVTGSALASISGSNDFEDFLVGFSSDFDQNFAVLATASWSTTYGTFSAGAGWTNAGAAPAPSGAKMTVNSPVVPGESLNMERCPPNFVDNLVMDAR